MVNHLQHLTNEKTDSLPVTLGCFGANYLVFIIFFINSDISKSELQRFQGSMAHFQHRVLLAAGLGIQDCSKLVCSYLHYINK